MSGYDQLSTLEAGHRPSGTYSDDPEFARLRRELEAKLSSLSSNIASLHTELGRRDTPRTRERIHDLLEKTKSVFQAAGEDIKNLQAREDTTPTQKYTQQKLSRQLKDHLSKFQTLQSKAIEKQKSQIAAISAESTSTPHRDGQDDHQLLQQEELRLAPQDDVDFQDALIREREEEIRNIEQGVGDLNVLFQQVAQIVSEQGEQLDTIADNVDNVHESTMGADFELRQAARYQKNARSKMCWLLIILAVILTIIILAVVLA